MQNDQRDYRNVFKQVLAKDSLKKQVSHFFRTNQLVGCFQTTSQQTTSQLVGCLQTTNQLVGGLQTTNQLVGRLQTSNQLVAGL